MWRSPVQKPVCRSSSVISASVRLISERKKGITFENTKELFVGKRMLHGGDIPEQQQPFVA